MVTPQDFRPHPERGDSDCAWGPVLTRAGCGGTACPRQRGGAAGPAPGSSLAGRRAELALQQTLLSCSLLQVVNVTGNQDICYYNFLCAHPLGNLRWGPGWPSPDAWGKGEPGKGRAVWEEAGTRLRPCAVSPLLVLSTTSSATWGTSCWGCSSCSSSCSGRSTTTGP